MTISVLNADSSPAEIVSAEKALISKVAWRLMPLIMVCYLFAFFDRINISFAKFQLQTDLSLSDTAYGLGAGLFVVGYVLFEVQQHDAVQGRRTALDRPDHDVLGCGDGADGLRQY